jgi:uncharacterized protein YfaS (alpha-2-macroglobulin family)
MSTRPVPGPRGGAAAPTLARIVARGAALAAWLALLAAPAGAARLAGISLEGEIGAATQLRVSFDRPVVRLGTPGLAAPVTLDCPGATPAGDGRWADDRTWLLELRAPLPPGLRCTVRVIEGWQALDGTLQGRRSTTFSTGGPTVVQAHPWPGSEIEEEQHFILQLNGRVTDAEAAARAACEVEGLGERLPARVVGGAAREPLLRAQGLQRQADRTVVLSCTRPLPQAARMRLAWRSDTDLGLPAAGAPATAAREQRFDYTVRAAFTAEFACERERANAPCLPLRPLLVRFSAPVPRALAAAVRLEPLGPAAGGSGKAPAGAAIAPSFDRDDRSTEVTELRFAPPLAEQARFRVVLPTDLRDLAGRTLANARSFPLEVATGQAPPLAKFAAAPFGVVEWGPEAAVPVTLRRVQADLGPGAQGGQVRVRRIEGATEALRWFHRLQRLHETQLTARELGLPQAQWHEWREVQDARGRTVRQRVERMVGAREVSLLAGDAQARRLALPLPAPGDARAVEVVGIPITEPGYHVVEIESRRLGQALLAQAAPMYVRTGVLVTNLGVHFKHGRESSAVWVTTLDRGRPVAGADVAVHDCAGSRLWQGRTDAAGLARIGMPLSARAAGCHGEDGLFVTATRRDAAGREDFAFAFSGWMRGIEPWRFAVPTSPPAWAGPEPDARAHTVFDRTLLRAGETVSMKHFLRLQTATGLALPDPTRLPTRLKIVHVGSGDEFEQPLAWEGARSAVSAWAIPTGARLGAYRVELLRPGNGERDPARSWPAGEFRVEALRVPLVDARLSGPRATVIAPRELVLDAQLRYFNGGGLAQAPLRASALLRPRAPGFAGHEGFSFEPPRPQGAATVAAAGEGDEESDSAAPAGRLVADRQPALTSPEGAARIVLKNLPPVDRASEIVTELSFTDPNGEIQTVSTTTPVWPAAVVAGIQARTWVASRGRARFTALALDTEGRPMPGQALEVRGALRQTHSTRKRLVGGFYAWDNHVERQDLGVLCRGRADARGRLECEAPLERAGEVELVASARDRSGHFAQAATSLWITGAGELWFAQDDDDRIELLPEKTRYEPGQTARLQVRMPFRQATALVAVEREGVVHTRVVTLRGREPVIEVPIEPGWAPNVYVSVLAVRGRVREMSWRNAFGFDGREPLEWARSLWWDSRDYRAPTAMVDLAKPAFKLGVAALEVGTAAHTLQVSVTPERAQVAVRETARVRVRVTHAGQPVRGAEFAFAAVDEGLLALRPNDSWDLLQAMMQPRPWGVATSTAQGEIVGRRHYGRKAVAAGGGGGRGDARELFDTLLLWQPRLRLDDRGEAVVEVPLNDALTSFRLVAIADAPGPAGPGPSAAAQQRFGTGSARLRVTQDLQLLAGLPSLVREGDRFEALLTLRNTTDRAMTVQARLSGRALDAAGDARVLPELPAQTRQLAPGAAAELRWPVEVPVQAARLAWEATAAEAGSSGARDRLKLEQAVAPVVPVRTLQATLRALDGALEWPVQAPRDALRPGGVAEGGLTVTLQPTLGSRLPSLRRWFETYPYTCIEQQASRAAGLADAKLWAAVANQLPAYLDADGLASFFPPRPDEPARGSDRLTAYLLALAHEAGFEWPAPVRERMLDGLAAFVEGRIERIFWSPRPDLDARRLAAIEALARHGRARVRMLDAIASPPAQWPTAALLDTWSVLKRLQGLPGREQRLDEVQRLLRARLAGSTTALRFQREDEDAWWWLMDSADANAARLLLAAVDEPGWREEVPRLVLGHLARQQRGAWQTTTANAWSALALERYAQRFEAVPVRGRTTAAVAAQGGQAAGGAGPTPSAATSAPPSAPGAAASGPASSFPATQALDWSRLAEGGTLKLPWPPQTGTLRVAHEGSGRPWVLLQARAAVPLQAPLRAGYGITRTLLPVQRQDPARWSRGDIVRVRLEIDASADRTWVAVADPLPAGATVLGSGLARDSALATRGERREGAAWPTYEERTADAWRAYYEFLPRGRHVVEYTLRLNHAGRFGLPPTRVEAMYAPDSHGETPNPAWDVAP